MNSRLRAIACMLLASVGAALSAGSPSAAAEPTVRLAYRLESGDRIDMAVTHRALTETTVDGTTQTVETLTDSTKTWRVVAVDDKGRATLENSVDRVAMTSRTSDRGELRWDSRSGDPPPPGYEAVAASLGRPLSRVTIDRRGHVLKRVDLHAVPATNTGDFLVVPLPEKAVASGDEWTYPREIVVEVPNGPRKAVRTRMRYLLEAVEDGIATIRVDTTVLTPVDDPRLEVRLLERIWDGRVRFDVDRGIVLERSTDTDRRVVGFSGPDSSLHYAAHLEERYVDEARPAVPPDRGAAVD